MKLLYPFAQRYIAGDDFESAQLTANELITNGFEFSFNYVGEYSKTIDEATSALDTSTEKEIQEHLEELLIVSDKQAIDAQRLVLERAKVLPELAASCTLAAAQTIKDRFRPDDHLVLLMCGGNESVANLVNYAQMA